MEPCELRPPATMVYSTGQRKDRADGRFCGSRDMPTTGSRLLSSSHSCHRHRLCSVLQDSTTPPHKYKCDSFQTSHRYVHKMSIMMDEEVRSQTLTAARQSFGESKDTESRDLEKIALFHSHEAPRLPSLVRGVAVDQLQTVHTWCSGASFAGEQSACKCRSTPQTVRQNAQHGCSSGWSENYSRPEQESHTRVRPHLPCISSFLISMSTAWRISWRGQRRAVRANTRWLQHGACIWAVYRALGWHGWVAGGIVPCAPFSAGSAPIQP